MKMNFWKMHGAQNDFILFDNRNGTFPVEDREFLQRISTPHVGIGAEGVILIEESTSADFRMRFFNPDGGEAEMCGNGARCVARLALMLGIAQSRMSMETEAGTVRAQVMKKGVRLFLTIPSDWMLERTLELNGEEVTYGFVNTGVPHVMICTDDLENVDVQGIGKAIRNHPEFAPEGANVNFIQRLPEGEVAIRTYERGVEAETLACGTGATACGLLAACNEWLPLPVRVHVKSGDVLIVDAVLTDLGVRGVMLLGPAETVFEGTIEY